MNNLRMIKKSMTVVLTLLVLLSVVAPAMARKNDVASAGDVPVASSPAQGPTDAAEMEEFLDDLFAKDMEEYHIAGAAVAVVKDGQLFFAKGYGYADLENKIPVDPEQTIFKIGSVTKLFTWTAVMQLVEQGKLDLDADINTYLDFRIPDTYPQLITLKRLMSHTSGFEDKLSDILVTDAEDFVPVREWLVEHMHARVRPPGEVAAYSNFNTMLAGYIVARASGQSYEQYMQEHILDPLGMAHTTASMMRMDQRADMSAGYTYVDGAFQVSPGYLGQPAMVPGGGMFASATDIARFMIAHLQDGHYTDATIAEARILEESTAQQMHSTLYTPDPRLLGAAYGFFDMSDNGQRTLGHTGDAPPMNSMLLLLPDQNLGVFVVYNSEGGAELTTQHAGFQRAFFDHYYPAPAVEPIQPPADFAERADRFVGAYRITRGSYSNLEKVTGLFGGTVQLSDPGDGTLLLATPWGDWRIVEVEPLYFRQADGPVALVFREDDHGQITYMFTSVAPQFAFEKLKWYETPRFHMALLLVCALVFLSLIPVAAIRAIRSRRVNGNRKPEPRGARTAFWMILGISLLNLLFLLGTMQWGNPVPLFGVSMIYKLVLVLGVLSAALTVAALVYTALAWKKGYWGFVFRSYYSLVTIAAVAFVWFLNYWNLLGWRF